MRRLAWRPSRDDALVYALGAIGAVQGALLVRLVIERDWRYAATSAVYLASIAVGVWGMRWAMAAAREWRALARAARIDREMAEIAAAPVLMPIIHISPEGAGVALPMLDLRGETIVQIAIPIIHGIPDAIFRIEAEDEAPRYYRLAFSEGQIHEVERP